MYYLKKKNIIFYLNQIYMKNLVFQKVTFTIVNKDSSWLRIIYPTIFLTSLNNPLGFNTLKRLQYSNICQAKKQTNIVSNQVAIKPGQILNLTINSVISKKIGVTELSDGSTIFLPHGKLGDEVKAKIITVDTKKGSCYGVGELLEIVKESKIEAPVSVDEIFNLTIKERGPYGSGKVTFPNNYSLIIPNAIYDEKVNIKITRVKKNYAFGIILPSFIKNQLPSSKKKISLKTPQAMFHILKTKELQESTCTLTLPKSRNPLKMSNYWILNLKVQPNAPLTTSAGINEEEPKKLILFLKSGLGVKLGDQVRIKITKMIPTDGTNVGLAKIVKLAPNSKLEKQEIMLANLKKMLKNGMHFGDLKCHAFMKKYVWSKKNISSHTKNMSIDRQKNFKKKDRYIINLLRTRQCLKKSYYQLAKYAASGHTFLFVGTKKPAAGLVARAAALSQNSFYVNTRWLGGMLTNWNTLLKSISKIQPLLKEKQKILNNVLQKRHSIKLRLIQKINKLRQQSQQLLNKGKLFVTKMKNEEFSKSFNYFIEEKTLKKKKSLYWKKYQQYQTLLQKEKMVNNSFKMLFHQASQLLIKKKNLLYKQIKNLKKLSQLNLLLSLSYELYNINFCRTVQQSKNGNDFKPKKVFTLKSKQFVELNPNIWIVPNPPQKIIQKILYTLQGNDLKTSTQSELQNNRVAFENQKTVDTDKSVNPSEKAILVSKFLEKFTDFSVKETSLKREIENLKLSIHAQKQTLTEIQKNLSQIKDKMVFCLTLKQKIVNSLFLIKKQLSQYKKNFNNLLHKSKKLKASRKLLKFLPRIRYLASPKTKILESVQICMKNFVDPKLRYPMEKIYESKLKYQSKKRAAIRQQKWQRLEKYFGGVTAMTQLTPQQIRKNVVILIGQHEEMNAVLECRKLGIKMFHLVDTNCNPQLADYIIPSNDDSRNSISYIIHQLLIYIRLAQQIRKKISMSF
uniref:Small ribosomal subunit protein uS2c n=1 Tax=Jenufa minuta TaxID=993092 RepID=A0A0S2LNL2_JENMI|nr:ribosomal protein S2 [Jenufa minuta]ALO62987.1 ribosomal protein S2 [Jenufa minuta]